LFDGSSLGEETLFLLSLGLRSIFVEELEGLGGGVAVKSVLELCDGWRDLETEVQDLLLSLQADILGPSRQNMSVSSMLKCDQTFSDVVKSYLTIRDKFRLGWIS
jgi:hypothetical protein